MLICSAEAASALERQVSFDISAGELAAALYLYGSATGIEILVPRDMVAGRRSAGVAGVIAPEVALQRLLHGTGLAPKYLGNNAFTLVPVAPIVTPAVFAAPRHPDYSAALQAAIRRALCRFQETQPGDYRLAARLWIGASGAVSQLKFLGTTGDQHRDATLAGLLGAVSIHAAPPRDLVQPTTVLVVPRRDGDASCSTAGHLP